MSSVRQYITSLLGSGHGTELADRPLASAARAINPMVQLPPVRLGEACRVPVTDDDSVVSRVYLKQDGVFYLQPLADWGPRREVEFMPEAPGAYEVALELRRPDGSIKWKHCAFTASAGITTVPGPQLITVGEMKLWVPSTWESHLMSSHEHASIARLASVVPKGAVVYDIGANLGLYSIALARLAGPQGRLYCVEANPVCLYFLQMNLALNKVPSFEILPAAVSDGSASVDFTINYRNLMVGTASDLPYLGKPGHRVGVTTLSIDDAIARYELPPPDFVKIDIEGAEGAAIRGMRQTIERHAPTILVEIHGRTPAYETLALPWDGYAFEEAESGRTFDNADSLKSWFPDACLQIIARRK